MNVLQSLMGPKKITLGIIGCGQRGEAYAQYALVHPNECAVVAIAEPRVHARRTFERRHSTTIRRDLIFETWEQFADAASKAFEKDVKICDAIVIAVQDKMHCEALVPFASMGYDILCEKPLATSLDDCFKIADAVRKSGIIFGVAHVLRYSPYTQAISSIVESGELGKLINIIQVEPVGHWHFAHSYVRGNWHSEKDSSFVLMTKCCHDIDLMCKWLLPATPVRISSFGSLTHFNQSSKPVEAGSATRCLDCSIRDSCPYSAKKIYLEEVKSGNRGWPVSVIVDGLPDIENVTDSLKTGQYGLCVYESNNDVVDHQVVNIEFSTGSTVSFTMVAFTQQICERQVRLHFSHGEIIGDMHTFTVNDFRSMHNSGRHRPANEGGGHGGGDMGLMRAFVEAVRTRNQQALGVTVDEILDSHLTVFAAEAARKEKRVVEFEEFVHEMRREYEGQVISHG